MQKFELVLVNEKIKQYTLFALLIIVLNIVALSYLAVTRSELRYRCIAVVLLISVLFIIQHFANKKQKKFSAKGGAILLIIALYLSFKFWWAALIMALLAMLYIVSMRQFVLSVNANNIIYPSFPKRIIQWNELNNVIIRDGLLTLDFKNNKLIQVLIGRDRTDHDIDEKEFNDFCRRQLSNMPGQL